MAGWYLARHRLRNEVGGISRHSIRLRLTLWYGTVLLLVLLLFAAVVYMVMAERLQDQVDRSLEETARVAIRSLEERRFGPFLLLEDISEAFPELAVLDKFFQIFGPSGTITIQSSNLKRTEIPLSRTALEAAVKGQTTFESARYARMAPLRLVSVPIRHGGTLVNILQVGTSLQPIEETLHRLLLILLAAVPAALVAALGAGWFLARRALRPVQSITAAARRIAAGDLSQRLQVQSSDSPDGSKQHVYRTDEIGQLAATFNDMIARLEVSFRQIRQFSLDASHELRTPLTVMKGETELALRRSRTEEEYRAVLESSLEEIDRMSRIVDELLFLSRADLGEVRMTRAPVRVDGLLQDVQRHAPVLGGLVGDGRHAQIVEIITGPLEPVTVMGDELRLRELVLNLVDNAVKYSHPGGKVQVSLVRAGQKARLSIKDEGIGIAPEEQAHIFDRFYRTEAARAHAKTGTGLGLSICAWIAQAHDGRIEVQSEPGAGSTFTVVLPVAA
jgi:two-component system OmpR family sensor kinase